MTFWIVAGALSVVSLLVLAWPLLKKSSTRSQPENVHLAVYKTQLIEVDRDLERGVIGEVEADAARTEVQRRLIRAAEEKNENHRPVSGLVKVVCLGFALLVLPAGAFGLYGAIGAPGAPDKPLAERTEEQKQAAEWEQFNTMAEKLAARLKETPNDLKGWAMLGRSYRVLNRLEDSLKAYEKAFALAPADTEIALAYAETMIFFDDNIVSEKARGILEKIVAAEPKNLKARYYYGLVLSETAEELPKAIAVWKSLEADSPPTATWLTSLREQIRRAEESLAQLRKS